MGTVLRGRGPLEIDAVSNSLYQQWEKRKDVDMADLGISESDLLTSSLSDPVGDWHADDIVDMVDGWTSDFGPAVVRSYFSSRVPTTLNLRILNNRFDTEHPLLHLK